MSCLASFPFAVPTRFGWSEAKEVSTFTLAWVTVAASRSLSKFITISERSEELLILKSTGLVERFPTLIVSSLLLLSSLITFSFGLILKGLVNIKYENRYLAYMSSNRVFNRSS